MPSHADPPYDRLTTTPVVAMSPVNATVTTAIQLDSSIDPVSTRMTTVGAVTGSIRVRVCC